MPDRNHQDSIDENTTYPPDQIRPQTLSGVTDFDETGENVGHFASGEALHGYVHDPRDLVTDPVIRTPEEFATGFVDPDPFEVAWPIPTMAPLNAWQAVRGSGFIVGIELLGSATDTLQMFDGLGVTGAPRMLFPLTASGLYRSYGTRPIAFRHGLFLNTVGGAAMNGAVLILRTLDSIPN